MKDNTLKAYAAGGIAAVEAARGRLDEMAVEMEAKWGVDRLPKLVDQDLATKFYSQLIKLNEAMRTGGPADVEHEASRMVNAWMALDAAAEATGARKVDGVVWETSMRVKGAGDAPSDCTGILGICKTDHDARKLRQSDRYAYCISVEQVAKIIENLPQLVDVAAVFPQAEIIDVRQSTRGDVCLDEDLPPSMLEAG